MGNKQPEPNPSRPQGSSSASQGGQQGASSGEGRQQTQQNVHGEGNYEATRDYNARTKRFVESGKVDEAAREAQPDSEAEALQMAAAEAEGKRHAKEEDPALSRKSDKGERGPEDTSTPKPGEEEE
ncbi:MAG TPA: hypothetical protein VGI14_12005 [Casimicrobiaceae bacterium]|jgi:hypothetical protein